MNLAALETFYWIVRLGTFHDAAAKLNVTQPAISARIRELETGLGLTLFDRVGRSVRLTPKGRMVFVHAERIVANVETLLHQAGSSPALSGIVRIGAGELLTDLWLPAMLADLQHRYPGLLLDVEIDVTVNLRRKLEQGEIDIALLAGPLQGPELVVSPLTELEMCWAGAPPLVEAGTSLTAQQLAAMPVVTLSRVSYLHVQTQSWFASQGLTARQMHVCNSVALLVRLVALGFGVSLLPRMLLNSDPRLHEIRDCAAVPDLPLVSAMHHRGRNRPAEAVAHAAAYYAKQSVE